MSGSREQIEVYQAESTQAMCNHLLRNVEGALYPRHTSR